MHYAVCRKKPAVLQAFRQLSLLVKPHKEIIIGAIINLLKLYKYADPYIKLAYLVFCIAGSADIYAAELQLGTKLLLRKTVLNAQPSEVIAHIPITAYLLFHISGSVSTNIGYSSNGFYFPFSKKSSIL